ncbi:MAG: DUF4097 family beta strand repeat-containing protein [Planctomycetaceae bacterium]
MRGALALLAVLGACAARPVEVVVFEGAPGFTEEARREETVALDARAGDRIVLRSPFAWVRFQPAPDAASPRVRWSARIKARTREEAAALLAAIRVACSRDASAVRIDVEAQPLEIRQAGSIYRVNPTLEILVEMPAGCAVRAAVGAGDVIVAGPAGSCDIESSYGRIALSDVAGDIAARGGSGDIEIRGGRGESVSAATNYGRITMAGVKAARIVARSGSGGVSVTGVEGAVTADSSYGAVQVQGVLSVVAATSGSGAVTVTAAPASSAAGAWTIRSNHGDLLLTLPAALGCAIAATTRYGAIQSDLPGHSSERGLRFDAKAGAGGPTIELATGSGAVRIRLAD